MFKNSKQNNKQKKIWAGRISKNPSIDAEKFTSSIKIDKKLYAQDLIGTAAYVIGLEDIGILTKSELKEIIKALKVLKNKIEEGNIDYDSYEDVHSLVEFELEKIIGKIAYKIHTGRSRNDQVVLDELLFLKNAIADIINLVLELQSVLLLKANKNLDLVFPAYTHMQKAQPVLVAHYFLAYFEKFKRCIEKLFVNFETCNFLPIGAAACVGSGYAINRKLIAEILKFKFIASNSMDIVSNREYIVDFIYTCNIIMQNLSRFAEDLIIFNTQEFSYINIDDSFCTGSSIMPQKKNPDILELIRGKCSLVIGSLVQILTLLKAIPLTYDSDLQEDKKILFNVLDETSASLKIFSEVLKGIEFNKAKLKESCLSGYIEATDAADYLVKKGLEFREAHKIIGKLVSYCIENNLRLNDIKLEKLKEFSVLFDNDFYTSIELESCINSKVTDCGTSISSVKNNLLKAEGEISAFKYRFQNLLKKIPDFNEVVDKYLK